MPELAWYVATAMIFLSLLAFHLIVLGRQDFADDLYFSTALQERSLLEFLSFRYQHWTGRVPIEALLVTVSQHVLLWKILNTLAFFALCWSGASLVNVDAAPSVPAVVLTAFLFLMISPDTMWWSAWWLTGSVNYLWPAAAAATCLALYWRVGRLRPQVLVAGLLCGGFAAYSEQTGLLLVALVLVSTVWKALERSLTWWHCAYLVFIGLNFGVALSAPGNVGRFEAEQATWFPGFVLLGWPDKLNIGLGLLFRQLVSADNWIVTAGFSVAIYLVATSRGDALGRALIVLGLVWVVFNHMLLWVGPTPNWLVSFPLSEASGARPIVYAAMIVTGYAFACFVSATWRSLGQVSKPQGLFWCLVLGVGACTLVLVGWTPTSSASGSRVAFVFSTIMVIVTAKMLTRLWARGGKLDRAAFVTFTAFISLAALARLFLLFADGGHGK